MVMTGTSPERILPQLSSLRIFFVDGNFSSCSCSSPSSSPTSPFSRLLFSLLVKKSVCQSAQVAVFSYIAEGDACDNSHGESHFLEEGGCSHSAVTETQGSWDLKMLEPALGTVTAG